MEQEVQKPQNEVFDLDADSGLTLFLISFVSLASLSLGNPEAFCPFSQSPQWDRSPLAHSGKRLSSETFTGFPLSLYTLSASVPEITSPQTF